MTDKELEPRPPGRPRGFDREAALATAMELFWRHGYEGVSMADLTAAVGVAAPSLYAAFGSKAALYREALDLYAAGSGALDLSQDRGSLAEELEALLIDAAAAVAASGRPCMVTSGLLICHRDHDGLARELTQRRREFQAALEAKLSRWVAPPEAVALARYLVAVMQGLSAQARDGATAEELADIARRAAASATPHT